MNVEVTVGDPHRHAALQACNDAREQADGLLAKLVEVIEAGQGTPSEDSQLDTMSRQRVLRSHIISLRGLHRAVSLNARNTKSVTAEARHEVDRLHLQLQNLFYEQRHLEGEISACESYEHKYQQLPLIPVDEFLEQHPEHADADENTLMAARIEHERAEREALEQQRQELLKRKAKLIAENKKRKDDLANLDKDLEKFIDAAKPIQKRFEKVV